MALLKRYSFVVFATKLSAMKRLSLSTMLCFIVVALFSQGNTYFLSNPSLTPDGQTVIFAFEGDLWKAHVNDGNATRLNCNAGL